MLKYEPIQPANYSLKEGIFLAFTRHNWVLDDWEVPFTLQTSSKQKISHRGLERYSIYLHSLFVLWKRRYMYRWFNKLKYWITFSSTRFYSMLKQVNQFTTCEIESFRKTRWNEIKKGFVGTRRLVLTWHYHYTDGRNIINEHYAFLARD